MKNNIFKSFRFEIVLYSLLSLFYTLLTEAGLYFGFYAVRNMFKKMSGSLENRKGVMEETANKLFNNLAELNNGRNLYERRTKEFHFMEQEGIGIFLGIMIIAGIFLFIFYFLLLTKKFAVYLEEIAAGINEISMGNFDTKININNGDEFARIGNCLNKMTDEIRILMENERSNEKTKHELITSVAHDLRTPLTSIIGYLDLALRYPETSDEAREKYLLIAYDKSKRLENLIEDLFSYTKYSSGAVKANLTKIDMVKFMEQMAEEFYPSFQEAGLEYEFITSHKSAVVLGDGDLLARAVTNLIGNAMKYGKDGKIVRIKVEKGMEDLRVSIINYGEIIPEKDLEYVFDRFYRVENSRSQETGGTGLGLAIAKKIILMHDGTLTVKSDFDGTIFSITLHLTN